MTTPARSALPASVAIYRGSLWTLRVYFDWDVSSYAFSLKLAPDLNSDDGLITADVDATFQADEVPNRYVEFSIDENETSSIPPEVHLLHWDVDNGQGETYLWGSVPVVGQVGSAT